MRSDKNEKTSNLEKGWLRNEKSGDCCCKAQKALPHLIGTFFVPFYRL